MKWVLIIFFHVGPMGDGNSNATTTIEFKSSVMCEAARPKLDVLVKNTYKQVRSVCVRVE